MNTVESFVFIVSVILMSVVLPLSFIYVLTLNLHGWNVLYALCFLGLIIEVRLIHQDWRNRKGPRGKGETFADRDFSLKAEAISWLAEEKARREHMRH